MADELVVCVSMGRGTAMARNAAGETISIPVTDKLIKRMGDMTRRFFYAVICPVNGYKLGKYAPFPEWG